MRWGQVYSIGIVYKKIINSFLDGIFCNDWRWWLAYHWNHRFSSWHNRIQSPWLSWVHRYLAPIVRLNSRIFHFCVGVWLGGLPRILPVTFRNSESFFMQDLNRILESRQHSVPAIRHNNTFVNSFNETIYNPDQAHSVKVGWSVDEICLILCRLHLIIMQHLICYIFVF